MRTCTGRGVATDVADATTTSAVPAPATTVRPRSTGKLLFTPAMVMFLQEHRAYKFEVAVSIVFRKIADSTAVTHPSVVLTSEMVDVYTDAAPPLVDANPQLLNFIEVYEQNGSGLVFSNFFSLNFSPVNIVAPIAS